MHLTTKDDVQVPSLYINLEMYYSAWLYNAMFFKEQLWTYVMKFDKLRTMTHFPQI